MKRCSTCDSHVGLGSKFCPNCGSQLELHPGAQQPEAIGRGATTQKTHFLDDDKPLPMPEDSIRQDAASLEGAGGKNAAAEQARSLHFLSDGKGESDRPRFSPGQVLGGRYLIMGQLGEGAMGEVYRAEDKRLGGSVALKFLAPRAATDAEGLRRLLLEARLARQVTHPNVCRVFDVGDVDGHTFISMEYIDGETISSLLRRIGRLPADKALNVAHQICAGVAWAHERGILHRDLKPANVMLDGAGEVRIADFGLAGLASESLRERHRAGTPAYMAPEVLRGKGASRKSDIFSLGLVLYEIFTGKPVYRASTIAELEALHDAPIAAPSTIVADMDPQVERVIMRCVERDPMLRPDSAREIAAALPGGDPLSAALSAGQTPSPRLVAAAGGTGVIGPEIAAYMTAGMLLALMLALWIGRMAGLTLQLPLSKSATVLAADAQGIVERLGYSVGTPYKAYGFDLYEEYLDLVKERDKSAKRWERLSMVRPAAIDFWYRQSPEPLMTLNPNQRVDINDPPFATAEMITLRLDPRGHLREFEYCIRPEVKPEEAMAAARASSGPSPSAQGPLLVNWKTVLDAAGLDGAKLQEISPVRVPTVFADTRAAWRGVYPESPQEPIRVEAAAYEGKIVAFRIVEEDWVEASIIKAPNPAGWKLAGTGLMFMVFAVATGAAIVLAWRNLRERTGDKEGALRLAIAMYLATALSIWLRADHPNDLVNEAKFIRNTLGYSLPAGIWFWVSYIAIEPYARRLWPQTLISWSRLVYGGFRDHLVGLHISVGALCGVVTSCLAYLHRLSPAWVHLPPPLPWIQPDRGVDPLQGPAMAVGSAIDILPYAAKFSITFLVGLLLLKFILRRKWAAAVAYTALQATVWTLTKNESVLTPLFAMVIASICTMLLVRFGLLALVSGVVTYEIMTTFAPSLALGHFTTPVAVCAIVGIAGIFAFGMLCAGGAVRPPQVNPLASGSVM